MERRRSVRMPIVSAARCSVGARAEDVTAYDISTDGCLIESSNGFVVVGDTVSIHFAGEAPFEGTVIWRKHRNAGVEFAEPLARTVVERIVQQSNDDLRAADEARNARLQSASSLAVRSKTLVAEILLGRHRPLATTLSCLWCAIVVAGCAVELLTVP
jgi:hypothetical protein